MKLLLTNNIITEDMEQIYNNGCNWDKLNHSSVFITGASGFIASYLTLFLIYLNEYKNAEIEIYVGTRNKEKADLRFGEYTGKPYFRLVTDDVISPVSNEISAEYIIHAASLASPQYYGKMPVETMLPNIVGTYELLRYASNKSCKGFLFFSSGAVYGGIDDKSVITEEYCGDLKYLDGGNEYGESKRCGEALCRAYFKEYNIPVKCARINHTYGPGIDYRNDKRVFSEFVNNIVCNENIILKSDGSAVRNFTYISDVVSALFTILLNGSNGEVYNIGSDNYCSISKLADILVGLYPERNLCVKRSVRMDPGYVSSPENSCTNISFDKLMALGWKSEYSIPSGFKRVIGYLSETGE